MKVANTNSHDLLAESQIWKSWKEVQVSICTRPTHGFIFILSQGITERGKVWEEIAKQLTMVISRRTSEGGILHQNLYNFTYFFAIAIVDKLGITFLCKPSAEICS